MAAARVTPRTLAPPEASGATRGGMRGVPRHTGEERGQGAAAARGAHTRLPTGGARRASLPQSQRWRDFRLPRRKARDLGFVHTFLSFECCDLNPDTCGS